LSYGTDGTIYETTGLYGSSKLHKIDPQTFQIIQSTTLDNKYFGEGSTYYTDKDGNGRIIEITWKEQTGFIYDADTLELLQQFQYTTTPPRHEGWGITYNPHEHEFIVSDGSNALYFWDADSLEEKRKVGVTRLWGKIQNMLNELEYMDGLICCNIWHQDTVICVDPASGKSVREYGECSVIDFLWVVAFPPD
jgi:glutamine cyclotransferase